MTFTADELATLLEQYEIDPRASSRRVRTLAASDPSNFFQQTLRTVIGRPLNRAVKFLIGVALSAALPEHLLNFHTHSPEEAISFADKVMTCEPHFDEMLLQFLLEQSAGKSPDTERLIHSGLAVLNSISKRESLIHGILKLLNHSNPRIASKAALFIGVRTDNLTWATRRAGEFDSRVRANILESLFGNNSEGVRELFRANISDDSPRVAANAVLGLYLLGEDDALSLIEELAQRPDARFRTSSAWVIGRTGDPRLLKLLTGFMSDSDAAVRNRAFKALAEFKKRRELAGRRGTT